ncbi:uncharacterized protein LOC132039480 [Lycium ferocissimum]|uniref:uncharacterized protein LOC132039480 n=1 Tax=Lycium ferocissimum TaxID=112874 RepID=UPI002815E47A|nr:uncharacterized protein LOC132039480 [Lycium ferocissimum]
MRKEFEALEANSTWDIVELPSGKKPIRCKWVYKVKYRADGSIERYKARLVVRDQVERIDFHETFSPIVKMSTIKTLVAVAIKQNWSFFQLDVNNAFLHWDLDEEVYMKLPPWIISTCFCFFSCSFSLQVTEVSIRTEIGFKAMLLPVICPLKLHETLKAAVGDPLPNPQTYRSLIGKLNFPTHTRPDLAFVVQHLSQFMQLPCIPHMKAALHVLRYLKGTSKYGLFLNNCSDLSLKVFCDCDWGACPDKKVSN